MNKRIVIPMSVTLAVGVILLGSLLHREQNQLTDARGEIVVLGENLASLGIVLAEETSTRKLAQAKEVTLSRTISSLEENVANLEITLAEEISRREDAEQKVASLQYHNITLSGTISSLRENVANLEITLAEETSRRERAEQEVGSLQQQVASLQYHNITLSGTISGLRRDIVTLETDLDEEISRRERAEQEVGSLQQQVASLQNRNLNLLDTISSLEKNLDAESDRLRKVQYAQHFASVAQLTNWLREDNTDTRDDSPMQLALVLQRRALMGGFLLPVALYWHENKLWIINIAVVGRNIYGINAENDSIEFKFFPDAAPPLLP